MAKKKKSTVLQYDKPHSSLVAARAWVLLQAKAGEALDCPCCLQRVKYYERKMNRRWLRALELYDEDDFKVPGVFIHWKETSKRLDMSTDFTKLHLWGFIESDGVVQLDGNSHSGNWRIATKGRDFLLKRIKIPHTLWTFDNRIVAKSEEQWDVDQLRAFGTRRFNYKKEVIDKSNPPQNSK